MKYPLIGITVSLIAGILAAHFFPLPLSAFLILTAAALAANFVFFRRRAYSAVPAQALFFFLGALLYANTKVLPHNHVSNFNYVTEAIDIVGIVAEEPREIGNKRQAFVLDAKRIIFNSREFAVAGKALVRMPADMNARFGDEVSITGKIDWPYNFGDGRFDYRAYLRRNGIYSIATVNTGSGIKVISHNRGSIIKQAAVSLKNRLIAILNDYLSPVSANLYSAMLLGERRAPPRQVNELFMRTGTVHILAVSGLHTGIAAFIFLSLLKSLRISRKPRFIITMSLLAFYCLLTGARVSVVRATLMAEVMLLGYVLEREVNIYNSLAIAAFIILLINPNQLFDIGFQLSFISVLSIVWLSPRIRRLFPEVLLKKRIVKFPILAFCVSLAAWLGTALPVWHYFGIVSPIAIFANMVVVPYLSIVVASGFLLLAFSFMIPALCGIVAATCELLISALLIFNSCLSGIPHAYFS
ncbi:MAG: ComEC/Rec2 family competence protein [Candidatus Omnitrophica bacterium]|nr:ComEC/Rec2 family competence protein [Candidatus Omnitrophota bacterium]